VSSYIILSLKYENKKEWNRNKKTRRTVIPIHIYQVWHDFKEIPSSVKESIETLKKQNPEFEHHLYDEAMCRAYLKDHFRNVWCKLLIK
jgi:mannosyltransferase OCH1-like enzyme